LGFVKLQHGTGNFRLGVGQKIRVASFIGFLVFLLSGFQFNFGNRFRLLNVLLATRSKPLLEALVLLVDLLGKLLRSFPLSKSLFLSSTLFVVATSEMPESVLNLFVILGKLIVREFFGWGSHRSTPPVGRGCIVLDLNLDFCRCFPFVTSGRGLYFLAHGCYGKILAVIPIQLIWKFIICHLSLLKHVKYHGGLQLQPLPNHR